MSERQPARVLCVDDEPIVLEILAHQLRREFTVVTAGSAEKALEQLGGDRPPFSVVLADMRMPGVTGVALLRQVQQIAPDTVRVLLTGQGDVDTIVSAVNEAQVYRFLTKPCTGQALISAIRSAADQHRANVEERAAVDRTLQGALKMLADVLALTSPAISAKVGRLQSLIKDVAGPLGVADRWPLEVAAMLSQITTAMANQVLAAAPRTEEIRAILAAQRGQGVRPMVTAGEPFAAAALILRAAIDYDSYETMGLPAQAVIDMMRARADVYDANLLAALAAARVKAAKPALAVKEIALAEIEPGMIFADDVVLKTGLVLVSRGFEVTERFIERAKTFKDGRVREPVKVLIPKAAA